ncbi:hypothetical protein [Meiothermus sp.]|uniref:hypothetical protein n=1 Tax=Meiothermus sp. TaxID=1955249 RepID=UPI0021DDAE1B|nr:hypothetical protein [Meiothermus sp.]GIW34864.1 MAG: hypothetical protein KatS3mg072_2197 [Meiothermus sp.]
MHNRLPSRTYPQPGLVYQAILVMDSRNVRTSLRREAQPRSNWSQLYQAGPYHLDLSLKWEECGPRLVGQVISRERISFEQARVYLKQDAVQIQIPLDLSGRFSLQLGPADHCNLELHIQGEVVCLDGLRLS